MSHKIHYKAARVIKDQSRFKWLLVGRRGGKTTTFIEDALMQVPHMPDRSEIFLIGPTNGHAIELYWDPLLEGIRRCGYYALPRVSKQFFNLGRGRKIYVIGAEKIKRVRGHKLWRAYLDEVAYYETPLNEVWQAVRPTLTDLAGNAYLGTTPNGKGTDAYNFFMECQGKENWSFHTWNSWENPFLDPKEIEEARKDLDDKSFRQEYEATWESFEGLAYYNFDEKKHLESCSRFQFNTPLCMMLDFNVNPTSMLLGECIGNDAFIRKEYSLRHSSTEETAETFCNDFQDKREEILIEIYGDASGENRSSNTGKSDYSYLRKTLDKYGFKYVMKVPRSNPPILDRLKYMNGWLKNSFGETRLHIDYSCKDLIRDLSSQELDRRHPSDRNNLGHKADALGYFVHWKQVIGMSKPTGTVQL